MEIAQVLQTDRRLLDDNSSCGGRETRDLDFRHHFTRETQEVLAKTQSNLGKW